MRTCPSCGKANNPIRKYCVRCGKSLLVIKEEASAKKPPTPAKQPEVIEKSVQPVVKEDTVKPAADGLSVTTNDQWVKPSQVRRERMRTTSSSRGKSEMEKAKEAFARAEKVGIQDEEGDIVETRMLRASEVREFMQDVSTQPQPSQQAVESSPSQPLQKPVEQPLGPSSTPPTKPAFDSPPRTPAGTPPGLTPASPAINSAMPPGTKQAQRTQPATPQKPAPAVKATPQIPPARPAVATTSAPRTLEAKPKEIDAILGSISHPEDLQDSKVKELLNELTNLYIEIQQVTTDKIAITKQLDTSVRESQNKAEVKRVNYESINDQLRLAKQELDDAKSEYSKAENRRKREISTLEDRVKNIQKRIDKAEGSVKKRISELDKVREKIAQLQDQES